MSNPDRLWKRLPVSSLLSGEGDGGHYVKGQHIWLFHQGSQTC